MKKRIVIAGGTGFIGKYFAENFQSLGYEVQIISRGTNYINWENTRAIKEALDGAELLINLAGKSVNCRYNAKNKKEILNSRTHTTQVLGNALHECRKTPALWINSSTATIYRHAEDRPMAEKHGEIGSGFSVDVAKAWEETFFNFKLAQTRQVALRIAIVLGDSGGVMNPYKNLVRFGLGGNQGSGRQMFSWIHIEDLFQIILFLMKNKELEGTFNCSSPNPVTNRELMAHLRRSMDKQFGIPTPAWMLKMGAILIRTETELVLKSRWVIPERLEQAGYRFKYSHLENALKEING